MHYVHVVKQQKQQRVNRNQESSQKRKRCAKRFPSSGRYQEVTRTRNANVNVDRDGARPYVICGGDDENLRVNLTGKESKVKVAEGDLMQVGASAS
jgi:hypothetical protein